MNYYDIFLLDVLLSLLWKMGYLVFIFSLMRPTK